MFVTGAHPVIAIRWAKAHAVQTSSAIRSPTPLQNISPRTRPNASAKPAIAARLSTHELRKGSVVL